MTSPAPPSSSSFLHSTPALTHRHVGFDASSSSPPTDVIATPSDRQESAFRGKNGKLQARRSVRIRTSPSGPFDSSPQLGRDEGGAFNGDSEYEAALSQARPTRGASNAPATRQTRTPRAPLLNRATTTQETLDALAQAQAHGITPDQFEAAKQQIMRFLREEAANGANASQQDHLANQHLHAYAAPLISNVQAHVPISSVFAPGAVAHAETPVSAPAETPHRPTPSRTPTASSALQAAIDLDASNGGGRSRPRSNFDDVVGRSVKRQKRESTSTAPPAAGSAVLQWAQEDSSSSSSDEDGPGLASMLTARRTGGGPSLPSPGLQVPSPGTAPTSDTNASPSIPSQRGMMDRYMSHQSARLAAAPEAAVPQVDLQVPQESVSHAAHPTAQGAEAPASPARQRSRYPAHVLQSPSPSKPPASILFSPDVARLLRSELDELEANAVGNRNPTSPSKLFDRRAENLGEPTSPSQRKASPLAHGGASRARDAPLPSQEKAMNKRARWSNTSGSIAEAAPISPTPSTASFGMKAPSFCDSSPAASERGSGPSRNFSLAITTDTALHPASAPDLLYGGPPSSSPTSSHHSDFYPQRFARSSPGPQPSVARSDSLSSAGEPAPSVRGKRTAARRDTAPAASALMYQGTTVKPPFSYAALIGQALFSTPDLRMALSDIYTWIMQKYPYFRKEDAGWQNSIRHNLSLNQCFIKTQRGPDNPGKGCLWAIKPGTEDQFVDGDFVRKNGQGNARRRGKGSPSTSQPKEEPAPPEPHDLQRDAAAVAMTKASHAARQATPASHSVKSDSPTPSVRSVPPAVQESHLPVITHDSAPPAYSPAPSSTSARSMTPAMASPPAHVAHLEPPLQITFSEPSPAPVTRPMSAAAVPMFGGPLVVQEAMPQTQLAPPAMLSRSHSSMGYLERNSVPTQSMVEPDIKPSLAPPAQLSRTTSAPMIASRSAPSALEPPPASPPQFRLSSQEPLLATTMSPPTSVYQRLAGPYQPLAYGSTSLQSHRALALLSSPEAGGIMPGRTSPSRARALTAGLTVGSPPSPASAAATFAAAPEPSRKRQRTGSEREFGMLSPTALVHISSPVSSIRGGARGPVSPTQDRQSLFADPDKRARRPAGSRLIPAVNALASSDFDPFRSPPPSSASSMSATVFGSAKYHLRSPSARLQAALSTPGGSKGRVPLGFSPSLATGASWERSTAGSNAVGNHDESAAAWDELYGGAVDTELEHFAPRGGLRSTWPSPGAHAGHIAW